MKERPDGFLAKDKIDHEEEIFDYIRELHEYLWCFVRAELPFANGRLRDYLDIAIQQINYRKEKEKK